MNYGFAFFPGQGAQAPGMGKDLYENSQAARLVFEEASDGAGIDVAKLCFDSDKETLSRTENSQIAIFTHSMAALAALREAGVTFKAAAGFSLGEYTSLAAAGVVSLADGVKIVFKRGKLVYDGHEVEIAAPDIDPDILAGVLDTFHLPDVTPEQLRIGVAPLIGLIDGQIVTEDLGHAEGIDDGICQMTVCERHHDTGHVASCYVRGYGIQRGAVATSIAHDSHNIIACGVSPEDIAFAVNELKKMHGGIIVVENGQVQARLPLEVAGLFTDRPLPEVNEKLEHCKAAAWAQGVNRGIDPFMTLSFASLPVIPALRLTTKGVFNVNTLTFVE